MKNITYCLYASLLLAAATLETACHSNRSTEQTAQSGQLADTTAAVTDPHSFAKPREAFVKDLALDLKVDFDKRQLSGTATYTIGAVASATEIVLDTRALRILKVTDQAGKPLAFRLGKPVKYLGQPLHISLPGQERTLVVHYQTTDSSAALQWLAPEQTAGKKHPFLYSQSQAILARTWLPCQDSPGIRFSYKATVEVPEGMTAVMSAQADSSRKTGQKFSFVMDKPIPAYLMALAAGELGFSPISNRTGIYAEPVVLQKAVYEFGDLEKMVQAAEALYGPYRWTRYDLLVLPPSFPFGGMENPMVTFLTPTVLAGDRSLTSLIAHELAHSWSGNYVTNATWNDFWLNEGFTVYFERRIMESLYGKPYADMLHVLGYQDLQHSLDEMGRNNPDTRLKLDLTGRDPDEGLTDIAYEKGNLFLVHLEQVMGREKFDNFLRSYFDTHAFGSVTTETFLLYLEKSLKPLKSTDFAQVKTDEWIYQPGLPEGHSAPVSARFAAVEKQLQSWKNGTAPAKLPTKEWSSHEWLHFLRLLPADLSTAQMAELDKAFGFTASGNSEILAAWLQLAVNRQYKPAYQALEFFLVNTGRRKFLTPLYKALQQTPEGKKMAISIYRKARPNYHAVATATLDEMGLRGN